MSKLLQLRKAETLADLADILNFKPKSLSFILYKQSAAAKYHSFEIPKRSGGKRSISAPKNALKTLQQNLSELLQDCADELNEKRIRKDSIAHGFKRQRSIITNARVHRRRRWILNLDLEDFFTSINFGRVRGFFIRNRDFALNENVATIVAQIACHNGVLPQGSPSSPVISNLIAHILDLHLVTLASQAGCTYSRYADDLSFSTNKRDFPASIANRGASGSDSFHEWLAADGVVKIVERDGFRINTKKTHMMYKDSRQDVTGIVVNSKLSVRCDYRHQVRAMVHRLVTTGEFELGELGEQSAASDEPRKGTLDQLHGMLGFIDQVRRSNTRPTSSAHATPGAESVYRTFLFYKEFFAASRPVIVCEGETDNVYLTHAIRRLALDFKNLAEVDGDKTRLKIRLYKHSHSSTARLLGLNDGGSSGLNKFIAMYKEESSHFTAPISAHPVLVLYDNDDGAKQLQLRKWIGGPSNAALDVNTPFHHLFKNVYAVPTPLLSGATPSKIEDFFTASLKATVLAGKRFNDSNSQDSTTEYGKKVFAHMVVRPNADTVDFSGFRPLLERISTVIESYRNSQSATRS